MGSSCAKFCYGYDNTSSDSAITQPIYTTALYDIHYIFAILVSGINLRVKLYKKTKNSQTYYMYYKQFSSITSVLKLLQTSAGRVTSLTKGSILHIPSSFRH